MNFIKGIFTVLVLSSIFFACSQDDGEGAVELNFKLMYDGSPLVAGEEYMYPLGFPFIVTKYSMFLSELNISNSESSIDLSQAVFLDLAGNQFDMENAQKGSSVRFDNIPAGNYSMLNISIGLPETLNGTNPSNYTVDSPLSNTGEYWEGWESYIFHKLEGRMDADNDGELESGIALHIGSNDAYRTKQVNRDIRVTNDETAVVEIAIDLKDILEVNGAAFDLIETPQVHHLGVLPQVLPLMDNLIGSI